VSLVTVIFAVASATLVFVIAAVAVGREARRLDAVAPRAVYELEDAVAFVAAKLPATSQARLTFDEVRELLVAHMRWMHAKGLQPRDVIDRRQDIEDEVVVHEETLTAWLLGEAERLEIELLDDVDAVHVVQAHLAYFDEIGAVGPRASS
jgi:putative Ca2+/H+ antiporter (TMEM165/GDT1 family)